MQDLLHDLVELNTTWVFEMERATTKQIDAGTWQVTLEVRAQKVVMDSSVLIPRYP